jgi:hypothetical protein
MRLHQILIITSVLLLGGFSSAFGKGIERPSTICEINLPGVGGVPDRKLIIEMIEAAKHAGYKPEGSVEWSEGYFEIFKEVSQTEHHRVGIWLVWKFDAPARTLRVYSFYQKLHYYTGTGWKQVPTDEKTLLVETAGLYDAIRSKCGL